MGRLRSNVYTGRVSCAGEGLNEKARSSTLSLQPVRPLSTIYSRPRRRLMPGTCGADEEGNDACIRDGARKALTMRTLRDAMRGLTGAGLAGLFVLTLAPAVRAQTSGFRPATG